jgi:hypothetical protein
VKKRWVLKILLLVVSALVPLLALEVALRTSYVKPWYDQLVEDQEKSFFRFRTSKNRLRDKDYATPKPEGHARILLLGDSFTVGQGVTNRREIFADVLERRLNRLLPKDSAVSRIDVLNGGLGGSLTDKWVELYDHIAGRFEPDVVIAVFFLRDGTQTSSMGAFFGPIRDEIVERNQNSSLYQHCYLYRFFRDRLDRGHIAKNYIEVFLTAYFGEESETEEWRRAQRNLLALRDRARARDAEFGLVVFPILASFDDQPYPFGEVVEAVVSFAEKNEMPVHDLLPAFAGRKAPDLWVSPYDQHPNKEGHAIASESLLPFFQEMLEAAGVH